MMTTTTKTRASSKRKLPPTIGPQVVRWIESNLVHGEGDYFGEPFILDPWQKRFIYRLYEVDPNTGARVCRNAVLGIAKGGGKTELAAAIGLAELAGPTSPSYEGSRLTAGLRSSPNIPVGAASFEQANLVYGTAATMVKEGRLGPFLEVFDTEMKVRDQPGRMFRVAAKAGTNDGGRPTAAIFDELHEWVLPATERVHLVISNSLAKRQSGLSLNISTAGARLDSLLGRMYQKGKRIEAGELDDPSFLFVWYEADQKWDLDKPAELRAAIREANPASFVDVERIAARYEVDRIAEYEFRRYHLNQWTATSKQWLPTGAWDPLSSDRKVKKGTEVVLGFDGSYRRDSTALIGVTMEDVPHVFALGVWENPDRDEWKVPREEVDAAVAEAFKRYKVIELAFDPPGWHRETDDWIEHYGEDVVVEFPTMSPKRMAGACSRFYSAVVTGGLTHDGNATISRHLSNAATKESPYGTRITKDHTDSPRKIDAAVAAVVAVSRATERREQAEIAPTMGFQTL
jgi:phage terminase large subunit-like protein